MKPGYLNDAESEKLSKLGKENPFRVPDNYFDSLADTIQAKINAIPDLEKMKRENIFQIPEGYFDSLPSSIQQRIIDQKKKTVFKEWLSVALRPRYAVSFAMLLILAVFGIRFLLKPGVAERTDNDLSYAEIQNSGYLADLDESVLIDILEQENTGSTVQENNEMEEYLMENDIDISQLENRL